MLLALLAALIPKLQQSTQPVEFERHHPSPSTTSPLNPPSAITDKKLSLLQVGAMGVFRGSVMNCEGCLVLPGVAIETLTPFHFATVQVWSHVLQFLQDRVLAVLTSHKTTVVACCCYLLFT